MGVDLQVSTGISSCENEFVGEDDEVPLSSSILEATERFNGWTEDEIRFASGKKLVGGSLRFPFELDVDSGLITFGDDDDEVCFRVLACWIAL